MHKSKFHRAFTPSARRLLDGVAGPVPRRSTEPARPRREPYSLVDLRTGPIPPKSPAVRAPCAARTAPRNFRCCGVPKAAGSFVILSSTRRQASTSGSEASSISGLSSFSSLVCAALVSGVTVALVASRGAASSAAAALWAVAVSALVPFLQHRSMAHRRPAMPDFSAVGRFRAPISSFCSRDQLAREGPCAGSSLAYSLVRKKGDVASAKTYKTSQLRPSALRALAKRPAACWRSLSSHSSSDSALGELYRPPRLSRGACT